MTETPRIRTATSIANWTVKEAPEFLQDIGPPPFTVFGRTDVRISRSRHQRRPALHQHRCSPAEYLIVGHGEHDFVHTGAQREPYPLEARIDEARKSRRPALPSVHAGIHWLAVYEDGHVVAVPDPHGQTTRC